MEKEKVLGFDVCNISKHELIKKIFEDYNNNIQNAIINVNPEIVINNYENKKLVERFNEQKYQIPDGIGIVYASKINGGKIRERIAGIDLLYMICEEAVKYNARVFLYGTQQDIIDKAKVELENQFKGINIVGTCNGFTDEDVVVERIKETKPDILFIGTGSPKQEKFMLNNKEKLSEIRILLPVGGSFDVISKTLKRAPDWMKKSNLEWLYRLFQEPKRVFRQAKLLKFVFCVIINKLKKIK